MKPLRISVKNLGAIPAAEVDLSGITLAAICGANGLGKSTMFTTAPRFALFGNLKPGTRVDDMVRSDTSEMSVCFDFEHQGDVWRVIRTRSTKGKGKSTLELQRQSGELWASESGASIDETQKKIIDLLNLTDETFVASSMILQGDASNFTARPAGQRKAILAQILQLDQYEDLQEKARAKVAATNISLERDKAMLATLETRLAERPAIAEQLSLSETRLESLTADETKADLSLVGLQVELANATLRQEKADHLLQQSNDLTEDLSQKAKSLDQQTYRLKVSDTYILQETDVLFKAGEHDRIREQVTVLQAKDDHRKALARDGEQITRDLEQMESFLKKVHMDIGDAEKLLLEQPVLEKAVGNLDAAKAWLDSHEVAKATFDEESRKLYQATSNVANKKYILKAESMSKENEIGIFNNRAAMLQDAQCIDINRAQCKFLADAKKAKEKASQLQEAHDVWLSEANAAIAFDEGLVKGIIASRDAADYIPEAHASAKKQVDELSAMELRLKSLEGTAALLENLIAQRVDLEARKLATAERRQALREDYRKLNEELAELPALNAKLAELSPYLKQRDLLPAVREQQKSAREQIDTLNTEIASLTLRVNQIKQLYIETVPDGGVVQGYKDCLAERVQELEQIRRDKSTATLQIGALTAKLEALAKDATERETISQRMAPLAKELTRWQILVKAFGRDGIPALIIENTVPELERIANEILGQMSGGKHNLRFETQRELKSKAGIAETLDIIVGDWAGERIYETFSGGEQLRIDFAIRFALAELLARRAGARVDWLTIDEGFGSQSDEYLPLVIDAVKSVANRFGMVLVISHVKQVQEAFEQTIVFRADGESVEVKVA